MEITPVSGKDFLKVESLAEKTEELVGHPEHFYRIMELYFGDSFFVARDGGNVAGFILGFKSQRGPGTWFLWQIGVEKAFRDKGLGSSLVERAMQWARDAGCGRIHVTVETGNGPSQALFESLGFENVSERFGKTVKREGKSALRDWYGSGTDQILYELKL